MSFGIKEMEKTLDDEDVETLQKRMKLALEKKERYLATGMGNIGFIEKMIHNIEDALMKKELDTLRREVQRLRHENRIRTEEEEDVIVLTQERNQVEQLLKENNALRQRVAELENLVPKQIQKPKLDKEDVLKEQIEKARRIIAEYKISFMEETDVLTKKMIEKHIRKLQNDEKRFIKELAQLQDYKKRRVESCIVCADTAAYAATIYYCGPKCRDQHCTK